MGSKTAEWEVLKAEFEVYRLSGKCMMSSIYIATILNKECSRDNILYSHFNFGQGYYPLTLISRLNLISANINLSLKSILRLYKSFN